MCIVVRLVLRSSPQFFTKKQVFDPDFIERALNDVAIKLRCKARIWCGSNVYDYVDSTIHQQF